VAKGKDKTDSGEGGGKSKGGATKLAIGGLLLLGLGAGGAYAAVAMHLVPGLEAGGKEEVDEPKLVLKTENDPYPFGSADKETDAPAPVYGEGGSKYRTAYYSFTEGFTSNLSDSTGLVQVELSVSTRRDGRVLQWVKTHEIAIRSAILAQLAATSEAEAIGVEGKKRLAGRLTKAINEVLVEKEGFGGIDAVFFRGFLVQ
jgi:flagellar FliL protein